MINLRTIKVTIRFIAERDEGGFHVYCPELKGLHVDGKTEEEAFENAKVAAEAYIRSILKHNDPLPVGSQDSTESLWHIIKQRIAARFWRPHARIEELSIDAA